MGYFMLYRTPVETGTRVERGRGGPPRRAKHRRCCPATAMSPAQLGGYLVKQKKTCCFCSAESRGRSERRSRRHWKGQWKEGRALVGGQPRAGAEKTEAGAHRQSGYYPHRTWALGLIYSSNVELGKLLLFNENLSFGLSRLFAGLYRLSRHFRGKAFLHICDLKQSARNV